MYYLVTAAVAYSAGAEISARMLMGGVSVVAHLKTVPHSYGILRQTATKYLKGGGFHTMSLTTNIRKLQAVSFERVLNGRERSIPNISSLPHGSIIITAL